MRQEVWWGVAILLSYTLAYRTSVWRSLKSLRLSWKGITRLYPLCFVLLNGYLLPPTLSSQSLLPLTPLGTCKVIQTPVVTLTCRQTMLLSKQFVQWDELLCQLEAAKQVKPAEE